MFFNEKDRKKSEEEVMKAKLESDFVDFIMQQMLESDALSEKEKLSIRVGKATKEVSLIIKDQILERYATPRDAADEETLRQVVEYLSLLKTGIMQFVKSTPVKREEN